MPDFIESLKLEIELRATKYPLFIDTIYFGGGTPSIIPINLLEEVVRVIKLNFKISDNPEITIECNPDDINRDYLEKILHLGFNRISIGNQSFNDTDLYKMGRRHNSAQGLNSIDEAKKSGFKNISVDFIYGLPWSSENLFLENLNVLKNIEVHHVSAYHLSIENKTRFYNLNQQGKLGYLNDQGSYNQYLLLCDVLTQIGMTHYEVSNFCKPGYESKHNSSYWNQISYIGFGAGGHSFVDNKRFWNKPDLKNYISKKFSLIYREENLSKTDRFNEMIMLGLRTINGVNIEDCRENFPEFYNDFYIKAKKWCGNNKLYIIENRLICNEKNWFQVDGIIQDFIIQN